MWPLVLHAPLGLSKPNQKVGLLGEFFGSTDIRKSLIDRVDPTPLKRGWGVHPENYET